MLGKLAAHSVNAFFGLLAIFPVLALPLLLGSVTGLEFSRLLLVFGTTLLFSLSLGLAVSSTTDDPRKALGGALILMAVVAGLFPVLWWLQKMLSTHRNSIFSYGQVQRMCFDALLILTIARSSDQAIFGIPFKPSGS